MSEWDEFDNPPSRVGTYSVKWDACGRKFGRDGIIPLWVADMDFATPVEVRRELAGTVEQGVFGYRYRTDGFQQAIIDWLAQRYNWTVEKKNLISYPAGTVSAVSLMVELFTEPGDQVMVHTPAYPPLVKMVHNLGRELQACPLKLSEQGYRLDLAAMRDQIRPRTRLLLFCSPHNPTGRVWQKSELAALGELCREHDILVISDEIHADLTAPGVEHIHFNRIDPTHRPAAVTVISSCKTFNLAGLPQATLICDDPVLSRKIRTRLLRDQVHLDTTFAAVATEAAYRQGADWLRRLMLYVQGNRDALQTFLRERLPQLSLVPAEGTYLAWLDCRKLNLDNAALQRIWVEKAGVGLYDGREFGEDGEGFFRINLACSRQLLLRAFHQIESALRAGAVIG